MASSVDIIDSHVAAVVRMSVDNEDSARALIPHLMGATAAINVFTAQAHVDTGTPEMFKLPSGEDLVEKLKEWVQKLVAKLAELAQTLLDGTTFSLTVGSSITLTVNFPSFRAGT